IELNDFLEKINEYIEFNDIKDLQDFYNSVKRHALIVKTSDGKQQAIIDLYNNFFKIAFPKMVTSLGIVYTPTPIVDYILKSTDDILRAEFGCGLTDKGVNILDPFTGTGTFITRLLQSGLIKEEDIGRKYKEEIFANEIVLLAYYISAINIETIYHDITGSEIYEIFKGICLTDSFMFNEIAMHGDLLDSENSDRIYEQSKLPIKVIIGNPPYSVHGSIDSNSNKVIYDGLNKRIKETYLVESESTSVKSMYDSYIRSFRSMTDRIGNNDGIIGFVSNGGWLKNNSGKGLRICFEKEFSKIYIFDLRGDARLSGELRKKEGGNVFDGCKGTRTPIAITILVRRKDFKGTAKIYYADIGNYLNDKEKLMIIKNSKSFLSDTMVNMNVLDIKRAGNWLIQQNQIYKNFVPLSLDKVNKIQNNPNSVFTMSSQSITTGRDKWVYAFSVESLTNKINKTIDYYNEQRIANTLESDPCRISWGRDLLAYRRQNKIIGFNDKLIIKSLYRPFVTKFIYYSKNLIERIGHFDAFLPTSDTENLFIVLSGAGIRFPFSTLITNKVVDITCLEASRCYPLYTYDIKDINTKEINQINLFKESETHNISRKDGISDYYANLVEKKYSEKFNKDDIFYYVYGILHSMEYRTKFSDDLKLKLPKIPLVESVVDFRSFSLAGRNLAYLHLNYEVVPPLNDVKVTIKKENYEVTKMRYQNVHKKDIIIYNEHIIIENIPRLAHEYILKGKSAIRHIMDNYQITIDKDSGIVMNPNEWCEQVNNPKYIFELLLSIISVSVKTMDIVNGLPHLNLSDKIDKDILPVNND
ncbi:MAG: hypothetical protein LBF68_04850, partial [Christensenellaceae bacterium]|nr:hypothetical protein [Christensenellaceae bacterium]